MRLMMRLIVLIWTMAIGTIGVAFAVEPINIASDDVALDLTGALEFYRNAGDNVQVSTAPRPDGVVSRIEIRSSIDDPSGNWAVFALANPTDQQIDRIIVAPHYRLPGSGLLELDLGSPRLVAITPSEGFALDRIEDDAADAFQVTLDPGTVVTFVAELASPNVPQLYLWEPEAYKDTINSFTLFRGIVLGISGLLALFLTIVFVVRGTSLFPATAALAWAVLLYICIDFGFLDRALAISPDNQQIWRAGSEVGLALTLVLFLFTYLNLNRWHDNFIYGALVWVLGLSAIGGVAAFDPAIAATVARISFAATAVVGLVFVIALSFQRYDRAIMLTPSWILLLIWLAGAWMAVTGRLDNDIVQPALGGGLVLILLLISFTVLQHAFSGGSVHQGLFSDLERKALAVTGAGDLVWDWDVLRDRIVTGVDISAALGVKRSALEGPIRDWIPLLHPEDRDRFRATLDGIVTHRRGRIQQEFRLRRDNNHYEWFSLKARPVIGNDGEVLRCVGMMSNVSNQKLAEERLLADSVHDNLTGLPNRQLFMDRVNNLVTLARSGEQLRPTIFIIDIDRFRQINESIGANAGDTLLLTVARRLTRLLKPQDALSRFNGDQFALMLVSEQAAQRVASFAEAIKQTIGTPFTFAKREIVMTASVGLVTLTSSQSSADGLIQEAELAMQHAKRMGGDRIEPFRPAFRSVNTNRMQMEADLRRAIERREISVHYQPIVQLDSGQLAGFEALLRWQNGRRGSIAPAEFIPIAEDTGLIVPLGQYVLKQATQDLTHWKKKLNAPLFVSVNISSRQLIRLDMVHEVRNALDTADIHPKELKLELTESMVMDNPEQSAHILRNLKSLGIGLSLDDFGTGHSSLSYLERFSFDTLKIDKSFVRGESGNRSVLLKTIIQMALELGMDVIAEGAETEAEALELRQLGCTFVQGYLFGEPMDADAVSKVLREQLASKT